MKKKRFTNYFKQGMISSRGISNNIFKFYLLMILFYITYPFVIIGSIVRLAYFRNNNNLINGRGFKLIDSFRDSNDPKFLKKVMLTSLIQRLFLCGLFLVFTLIGSLFYAISFGLYNTLISDFSVYYLAYIPISILVIIYLWYVIFVVIPIEQIYINNNDLNIINCIKYSLLSGFSNKFNLVLSFIIEFVPKAIFITGIVVNAIYIDKSLIAVVILLFYLIFMPKLTLINILLRYDLREDMIYNESIENRASYSKEILGRKGVNVSEIFGYKIKDKEIEENKKEIKDNTNNLDNLEVSELEKNEVNDNVEPLIVDDFNKDIESKDNDQTDLKDDSLETTVEPQVETSEETTEPQAETKGEPIVETKEELIVEVKEEKLEPQVESKEETIEPLVESKEDTTTKPVEITKEDLNETLEETKGKDKIIIKENTKKFTKPIVKKEKLSETENKPKEKKTIVKKVVKENDNKSLVKKVSTTSKKVLVKKESKDVKETKTLNNKK